MKDQEYLFVYGTLRRAHRSLMSQWLAGNAKFSGRGTYRGKLLNLGRYPGAVLSRNASDNVLGDLYLLGAGGATLRLLDNYEGKEFCRKKAAISVKNSRNLSAWIYLFRGPASGLPVIRGGNYLRFLKKPNQALL